MMALCGACTHRASPHTAACTSAHVSQGTNLTALVPENPSAVHCAPPCGHWTRCDCAHNPPPPPPPPPTPPQSACLQCDQPIPVPLVHGVHAEAPYEATYPFETAPLVAWRATVDQLQVARTWQHTRVAIATPSLNLQSSQGPFLPSIRSALPRASRPRALHF